MKKITLAKARQNLFQLVSSVNISNNPITNEIQATIKVGNLGTKPVLKYSENTGIANNIAII